MNDPVIVALDFETANYEAHSACQLGAVRIEGWRIVSSKSWMIRPPDDTFVFSYLHGIAWEDVMDEPDFKGHWKSISAFIQGADFLAAHNAPFDKGVLNATARHYDLEAPGQSYIDSVKVARSVWNIRPTKLDNVCRVLGISLNHHEALSDASACAQILIKASHEGWKP